MRFQIKHTVSRAAVSILCVGVGTPGPFLLLSRAPSPSPEQPEPGACRPGCPDVPGRSGCCVTGAGDPVASIWGL